MLNMAMNGISSECKIWPIPCAFACSYMDGYKQMTRVQNTKAQNPDIKGEGASIKLLFQCYHDGWLAGLEKVLASYMV